MITIWGGKILLFRTITLVKKKLDVPYTESTVEYFFKNKQVSSHLRKIPRGRHAMIKEHIPIGHQKYLEWNPERFKR